MDRPDTRGVIAPRTRAVSLDGIRVEVPYPGSVISCNRYKWKGGRYTRPEAVAWRDMLAIQTSIAAREADLEDELHTASVLWVLLVCRFADAAHPDPSNLWKLSLDGIAQGLDRDDKGFRERVQAVHLGEKRPSLTFFILAGQDQGVLAALLAQDMIDVYANLLTGEPPSAGAVRYSPEPAP